jgi:hypothetical protein
MPCLNEASGVFAVGCYLMRCLRRAALAVVLIVASIVGVGIASATPAAAIGNANCLHESAGGGNFGAVACFYGVVQNADYTEFTNSTMYFLNDFGYGVILELAGWHINHTLWAYSGSPCTSWVEIGDSQGSGIASPPTPEPGYYYYLSTDSPTYGYSGIIIGSSDNSGSNHSYELVNGQNSYYAGFLDGTYVGYAGGLGYGTCYAQAGEELSGNDYSYGNALSIQYSASFLNYPLDWLDTSNSWHLGWNTSQYWYDHPCGVGFVSPNCLNLSFIASYELATSKP